MAKIVIVAFAIILIVSFWILWKKNLKATYVSEIIVTKPFDIVWQWLSNPLNYEKLYPNWIKKIIIASDGVYKVEDRFGKTYMMDVKLAKEYGIIDLYIHLPSGEEVSQSRVYPLSDTETAVVHVAKRWSGANAFVWFFHKTNTDRDFAHAKKTIELESLPENVSHF